MTLNIIEESQKERGRERARERDAYIHTYSWRGGARLACEVPIKIQSTEARRLRLKMIYFAEYSSDTLQRKVRMGS